MQREWSFEAKMLLCPVCWGSVECGETHKPLQHVGFVCVDRSGVMDPGEEGASGPTRAQHMKSHK